MISPQSRLAKRHPDWHISIPGRPAAEGRNQLVLDLSREAVCNFIVDTVDRLLSSAPIRYLKWDMNRYLTNAAADHLSASRQQEVSHRYVLGLYRILEEIRARHPDVLLEGCAGGGGRYDPGIMYYMPQIWTSDNTDAFSRIRIQYGTSIFFPPVSMGAHVSAVPNHQTGQSVPMDIRGQVAMSGNLGYELDLRSLPSGELEAIRKQISIYKKYRSLIQFGRFIRLADPFVTDEAAWMFLSPNSDEFLLFWFQPRSEANQPPRRLRLAYLDPDAVYRAEDLEVEGRGREFMNAGFLLPSANQKSSSLMIAFRKIEKSAGA